MIGKLTGVAKSFAADENGATVVEYGLIAGGLSIVIAIAVGLVGERCATFCTVPLPRFPANSFTAAGQRPAFSPALRSFVPSASASRASALPGRSGFCWLSCGAQPVAVTISKVAGTRPSGNPNFSR